ncbi:MAG: DNA polymerase III subunit gamma/tau [Candidatus Omnitrophota bacterium]
MSYLVLARKWRPQKFEQIIGQEHIAVTLKNAISLNRVAHAYLFSGPRGVGKTSMARILAMALSCESGPAPEPCNKCESCREIAEGRSLDVLEIDGASNRGIDQIRQLRENIKFSPAKCSFKIYIIDEVHQITPDGFNALLKTLEEPPAHVKFIFATTQVEKVLPTIISRCQRFDFKPLSVTAVAEKLADIARQEKLDIKQEAFPYIARASGGSMRDAESILDQLGSFCRGPAGVEDVSSMLGLMNFDMVSNGARKIIEHDGAGILLLIEEISNQGKELPQFVSGLMEHFRNILVSKLLNKQSAAALIILPEEQVCAITEQSGQLSIEEIFYIFDVLTRVQENLRRTLSARAIVEMACVKLTQREKLASLTELIEKISRLEQNLRGRSGPTERNAPVSAGARLEEKSRLPAVSAEVIAEQKPTAPPICSVQAGQENGKPEQHTEVFVQHWPELIGLLREGRGFIASSLEFGQISNWQDNVLTVAFPAQCGFYKETLERPENIRVVEEKAKEVFQQDIKIQFILSKDLEPLLPRQQAAPETAPETVYSPIIQEAVDLFEGKVISGSAER